MKAREIIGPPRPRRFAYADPPYLGCAQRYYGKLHPHAADYDKLSTHAELVARLESEFDGWALSLHAPSLPQILSICPVGVRVAAWVKPFSGTRPGIRARFAWEPVIYRARVTWHEGPQFADVLVKNGQRRTDPGEHFVGKKPEEFAAWVCDMLGYRAGDSITDLFPGSGAVTQAFAKLELVGEQFELRAA